MRAIRLLVLVEPPSVMIPLVMLLQMMLLMRTLKRVSARVVMEVCSKDQEVCLQVQISPQPRQKRGCSPLHAAGQLVGVSAPPEALAVESGDAGRIGILTHTIKER